MSIKSIVVISVIIVITGCSSFLQKPSEESILEDKTAINTEIINGWENLYSDDYTAAKKNFNNAFNPILPDSRALRGEGLTSLALFDDDASFNNILESIKLDPLNPASVAAAVFLDSEYPYEMDRYNDFIKSLEKTVKDKKAPEWLKREYNYIIFNYYHKITGNEDRAAAVKKRLGLLSGWKFLGPFSNVSGSGFGYDFVSLDELGNIDLGKVSPGRNNWKLEAFVPQLESKNLLVPASAYISNLAYSSVYALKKLDIRKNGIYQIVFSRNGAIEAFIDGEKVIADEQYSFGHNVFYITKPFEVGEHEIIVKCSNLEYLSGFNVAVCPISDIDIDTDRTEMYASLFPESCIYDPFLNSLCGEVNSIDFNADAVFWLIQTLITKGWNEQAHTVLSIVPEDKRNSNLYIWQDAMLSRALGDYTAYEQKMLMIAGRDSEFAPAVEYTLSNYISNKRYEKAREFIKHLNKKHFNSYKVLESELKMDMVDKEYRSAFLILDRIENKYPEITAAYYIILNYGRNLSSVTKKEIIKKLYAKGEYQGALYYDYLTQFSMEEYSTAKNKLQEYLKHYPVNEDLWIQLINLMYEDSSMKLNDIRNITAEVAKTFPMSYGIMVAEKNQSRYFYNELNYYSYIGQIGSFFLDPYSKMKEEKRLYSDALTKLINFYPQDLDTRDELRKFRGQEEFGKNVIVEDSYSLIDEYKESGYECDDSDAVIVHDERKEIYFGDGASSVFQHYILNIKTEKGVEDNRYQYLEFNPAFGSGELKEAYILKPDGTKIPTDRSGRKLVFPGLCPGDFIVIYYSVESFVSGEINNEIWTSYYLKSIYPIYSRSFDLIYPKDTVIDIKYNNTIADESKSEPEKFIDGYEKLHYCSELLPSVDPGSFSPDWRDISPWIDFSTINNWKRIISWYKKIYLGQSRPTLAITEKTEELCLGLTDAEDKIKAIFSFVSSGIEYEDLSFQYSNYIPQTADSILRDGYGDCKDQSVLLVSMLKAAGIDSYIALSNPNYTGEHPYLPSPRFSHAIVVVSLNSEMIYLDPTTQYFTYGEMPASMEGTYVLNIIENGSLEQLHTETELMKTYTFMEIDNILKTSEIRGSIVYQGLDAGICRSRFKGLDETDSRNLFTKITNAWMPGFLIDNLEFSNLNSLEFDPNIDFTGTLPSLVTSAGGDSYKINLPWADVKYSNIGYWIGIEEGVNSLSIPDTDLSYPEIQTFVIDIPADYSISHLPGTQKFQYGDGYIEYNYEQKDDKLICSRAIYIPAQYVPVDDIPDFRDFIKKGLLQQQENVFMKRL